MVFQRQCQVISSEYYTVKPHRTYLCNLTILPSRSYNRELAIRHSLGHAVITVVTALVGCGVAAIAADTGVTGAPSRVGDTGRAITPVASRAFARMLSAHSSQPLLFEENRGQTDSRVRYLARRGPYLIFLTPSQAVMSLPGRRVLKHGGEPHTIDDVMDSGPREALTMTLRGANPGADIEGVGESSTRVNYFIGNDSTKWLTGIRGFAKVRYRNVYPGIDLIYYGNGDELEYDLSVAPGADPRSIRIGFTGASGVEQEPSGNLIIHKGDHRIVLRNPDVYQSPIENSADVTTASRRRISARYVRKGPDEFGLEMGRYDSTRQLIIDPQLNFSTYLGGHATDEGEKVAVDAAGNAYVVGYSASPDFPLAAPLQNSNRGAYNAVVSKINPEVPGANSLVWSTYLGGNGTNIGRAIAVNSNGDVFITGDTAATNFPVTPGAYQTACKLQSGVCQTDLFAAHIDGSGANLLYSTYLGGSSKEFGFAIAVDAAGRMYLGANSGSSDLPTTSGAYQRSFAGGGASGSAYADGYIAVLNPAGQSAADLVYASYLGGSGSEQLYGLALDASGNIYVTGSTTSPNFPLTSSAYQTTNKGAGVLALGDAFITKLNPAGNGPLDLQYSTYLGGSNDDRGEGIMVDGAGRIYVTGITGSIAFPITSASAFQPAFAGGNCGGTPCDDAFVAKLDPTLSGAASLVYSTFFGGGGFDLGHSIALDAAGFVYVTGETGSTNLPLVNPIQSQCYGGCTPLPLDDVFVAKFDLSVPGAGGLLFSTYLGGNDVDTGWSIAVDTNGNTLVTGQTFSTNFPLMMAPQSICNGCAPFKSSSPSGDSFLIKICITNCPAGSLSTSALGFGAQSLQTPTAAQIVTVTNNGSGDLTISSINIGGSNAADFQQTNNCAVVLSPSATCQIDVTFNPSATGTRNASLSVGNNASGSLTAALTGTGTAPQLNLSTAALAFGTQILNVTSTQLSVTLANTGSGSLLINSISISGANAGDFSQTNNCPASLDQNASCLINVTFTPTAVGLRAAALGISDNSNVSPHTVTLAGTGVSPVASLSTTAIAFGTQNLNSTGAPQSVTLTNTGSASLTINSISISGANAGDFTQTNNCPTSLTQNSLCLINITFSPAATGSRAATLSISDNSSGSPQTVALTGTSVVPQVSLSTVVIIFGNQNLNVPSAAQAVTVTNTGSSPLTINSISISGANAADFNQTNNCPASLAQSTSCLINVVFTAAAAGVRTANLSISDNAGLSPQTVALSGTGAVPQVSLSSTAIVFGNQNLNTPSAVQSLTVSNMGSSSLTITSISIGGANPGDFAETSNCSGSLPPNTSCQISVVFTPVAAGARVAALSISDNASGSPQSIALSGAGVAPGPLLWPNGYSFAASFTVAPGKAAGSVSGFPALISGLIPDFRTAVSGGRVLNTCAQLIGNRTLTVPCDLIFTADASGSALLNWEFESYDAASGSVNVWVNVPTLTSNTTIYAWYGNATVTTLQTNPTATWDAKFLAVYHLSEDPSGPAPQLNDSTANANHAATAGAMATSEQVTGSIAGGLAFNGSSQYAVLGNAANFSFERTDSWSVSAWVRPGSNTYGSVVSKQTGSSLFRGWELFQRGGSANPTFAFECANQSSNRIATQTKAQFVVGSFHHLVATYNGTSQTSGVALYVDGVAQAKADLANSLNATIVNTTGADIAARDTNLSMALNSTLDEIRIYARGVILSPAWITAEYNNQSSPGTFFNVTTGLINGN